METLPWRLYHRDFTMETFPQRLYHGDFTAETLPWKLYHEDFSVETLLHRLYHRDFSAETLPQRPTMETFRRVLGKKSGFYRLLNANYLIDSGGKYSLFLFTICCP